MTVPEPAPVCREWFSRRWVTDRIAILGEPHLDRLLSANLWLVLGTRRDLLFDTGNGICPLGPILEELRPEAAKPLLAVVSHAHPDHVGGLHEFEERMIHVSEAAVASQGGAKPPLLARTWRKTIDVDTPTGDRSSPELLLTRMPHAGFDPMRFTTAAASPTGVLEDGDMLDLGDRSFEVLHLPGHSPGSIGLWDARSGVLLSGDAIYEGQLLDELPGSDIQTYLATMHRLARLPVEAVYPGHGKILVREQMLAIIAAYVATRT